MGRTASEKLEIIRLVEGSDLSVRQTLAMLGIERSTFYQWYRRYREHGPEGLEPRPPRKRARWNEIGPALVVQLVSSDGAACRTSSFGVASTNRPDRFKAKAR